MLRATVTATNSAGKTSASSNLTAAVLAKASAPVNTSLPVISGSASVGQTLQASTGVWTGAATNGFSYQWSRCNANGTACASISGATGQSYGVGQADLGMALRVSVTATNSTGSTSATSAASVIAATVVRTARFNAVLRPGQEVTPPARDADSRRGALHREGHRQDAQLDADVLAPQRPPDRRPPEQGPARRRTAWRSRRSAASACRPRTAR